ncbi:MAG: hypothetical protein J6X80_04935 [Lachnospiraceae bacterium]|nr:hypothetical protein [Lachnospiraceae bacterium]
MSDKKTKKDYKFIGLIAVEILFILTWIVLLFTGNKDIIHINPDSFTGEAFGDSNGIVISSNVTSNPFLLEKGVYRVKLKYHTDADQKNTVLLTGYSENYNPVKTNAVTLYSGQNETDYICYVTSKCEAGLSVNYSEGEFVIYGAELVKTNIFQREVIALAVFFFVILDIVYILSKKGCFTKERKVTCLLLSACCMLASLPLFTDYMVMGSDYIYHLLRIEGVKDGILAGYFPVRIYPEWIYGYGYIDAVMYGNFLLYFPAVLRLIGFSVTFSYKAFILFVNILTVVSSYICFKKIFNDKKAGVLASFLYVLMPYRLIALYNLSRAGVFCAAIFLPIVLLGLYKIFTDDLNDKKYKYNFIIASFGICGVLWNHVLTTEIIAFFIILFCLVLIKRTFTFKRFIQLLSTLLVSFAASLWFIIPFLDNYMNQNLQIKNVSARTIQSRGLFPAQLFAFFIKQDTNNTLYGMSGLESSLTLTVGFTIVLGLFLFLIAAALNDDKKNKYAVTGIIFTVVSVLTGWMCTMFFPWDKLQESNPLFKTLISSLQFPPRLLMVLSIFMIMTSLCAYMLFKEKGKFADAMVIGLIILSVMSSLFYTSELLNVNAPFRLYDVPEFGTGFTSGSEYIFDEIKSNYNDLLTYRDAIPSGNVEMSDYSKDGLDCKVSVINESGENGFVDLPMLFYIGYSAKDLDTGENMTCIFGDRCDIRVIIPDGYAGRFEVKYTGRGYWRIGDLLSALTIIAVGAWLFVSVKKSKKKA